MASPPSKVTPNSAMSTPCGARVPPVLTVTTSEVFPARPRVPPLMLVGPK